MKLTLGAFIARSRKEKGLTQKEFAEMLCVSDKTVSHWECDKTSPDISLLPIIADIFGITVDELLKGERKTAADTKESEAEEASSPLIYGLEVAFNKFRTKNYIPLALTVIAFLTGLFVNYYKTISPAYLVFLVMITVPVLLTAVFRGNFAPNLSSPYIDKESCSLYTLKANRITVNNLYFSFFVFLIPTTAFLTYLFAEGAFIVFPAGLALMLMCEIILRDKGILKTSGKPVEITKITALKILSLTLCFCALFVTCSSHLNSINREYVINKNTEYAAFDSVEEFIAYIEKDVPAPDSLSRFAHFTPSDKGTEITHYTQFGMDSTAIQPLSPNPDGEITYTYNNLEIAHVTFRDDTAMVCTHAALLKAEKNADTVIVKVHLLHFGSYAVIIILTLILYSVLKKKILSSPKKDKITLIKRF